MGVSADRQEVQQRFIERFLLTFPMISDPQWHVIDAWGVHKVLGITATRTTFLIGPDGTIAHVWPKVKVEGHADDVIRVLREIQSR